MNASQTPSLQAERRERTGTRYAQRLRKTGKLPVVIYGHGKTPAHVSVDAEQIEHAIHSGAHLLSIDLGEKKPETCLVRDVQYDYLGDNIIHVDLTRVDLSETVQVNVPLVWAGEERCAGLKHAGAYLEQLMTDLPVECRADAIPDEIRVDVGELEVGQTITVEQLALPSGVTTQQAPETAVVSVHISRVHEEEEALEAEGAEEGEMTEPEVIGESKEESKPAE